MNLKEKIFTQAVICCMIFTVVKAGAFLHSDGINRVKSAVKEQFEKNYTAGEIMETGSALLEKVKKAPAVIASSVAEATDSASSDNRLMRTQAEKSAVCMQRMRVRFFLRNQQGIRNFCEDTAIDKRISTYGNLAEVKVVQGEKVKKGDIIGIYRSNGGKKFYYDLEENLQT